MNMLSEVIYFPDQGQIMINGQNVVIASPKDALNLGIGMVHQHFKLVDVLSATENIILGLEGKLNIKEAAKRLKIFVINMDLKLIRNRRSTTCLCHRNRRLKL